MDRRRALATLTALAACRPKPMPTPGVTEEKPVAFASSAPSAMPSASVATTPYPSDEPIGKLADGALAVHDWILPGHRALLLVPTHLAPGARVPLLVALHGLGETGDEKSGAYAWVDRYGVHEGYAHARNPDSITVASLGKMATPTRVAELKASLAEAPFEGLVIACPYTPNIWKGDPELAVDAYTKWLFDVLVPKVRKECPVNARLGIDGVSLGGWVSLGVAVRRTSELDSIGCVQAAISGETPYADRLAKAFTTHGKRPLHLLTSEQDVFRNAVERLSAGLNKRGVPHTLRIAKGPHDQPFLRGPGSLEMLVWQGRALAG